MSKFMRFFSRHYDYEQNYDEEIGCDFIYCHDCNSHIHIKDCVECCICGNYYCSLCSRLRRIRGTNKYICEFCKDLYC